jgi:hypothetical protein
MNEFKWINNIIKIYGAIAAATVLVKKIIKKNIIIIFFLHTLLAFKLIQTYFYKFFQINVIFKNSKVDLNYHQNSKWSK